MIPGIVASIRRGGLPSGDPYFDNVVSLLHFDQSPILDQRDKTWTPAGDAHISTDQSKFGGASLRLDGAGDYISTPHSTDFNTETPFTVECWFRAAVLPSVSGQAKYLCSKLDTNTYQRGFILAINATDRPFFTLGNGSAEVNVSDVSFPQIETDRWYHIAGTFDGTTMRLFLDGVMLPETHVVTPANSTSGALQIGRDVNFSLRYWNGWIDDFRFTQGVARYTSNFTPPTAAHPDAG